MILGYCISKAWSWPRHIDICTRVMMLSYYSHTQREREGTKKKMRNNGEKVTFFYE